MSDALQPHVMLDLETMSTAPNAAIVQIGAAQFHLDGDGIFVSFERTVALQSSLLAGGSIDPKTVNWWREPGRPRHAIEHNAVSLGDALAHFIDWLPVDAIIWSHGAAFDVPVLESAYRSMGQTPPWSHRNVRDTRTLFALATSLAGWHKPEAHVAHIAVADAMQQVFEVQSACRALAALHR